jgi:hypothetical protein
MYSSTKRASLVESMVQITIANRDARIGHHHFGPEHDLINSIRSLEGIRPAYRRLIQEHNRNGSALNFLRRT